MKALKYILYGLVIAAAGGLLVYQWLVTKDLDTSDITKCILIIAASIVGMIKPRQRRKVSNKKAVYQKAYGEFIQNAFYDEPQLEKKFYAAVDDYNFDRNGAAIAKLEKLRKECQRTADLYAVTCFTALCYDGMGQYAEAVKHYDAAARIRNNTTLHSNMGLCWQRMGKYEEAEAAYNRAVQVDPNNAFAWNNLAALYFKQGAYADALDYAEQAIQIDSRMPQALSCAAICCALLGEQEEYENYYHQAVANGYDGRKIKNAIEQLNPNT